MPSSNNQEFVWTVADVRQLDNRLGSLEADMKAGLEDIRNLRTEVQTKNRLVIDNSSNYDWKAVSALIVAVIGAIGAMYLTIRTGR